MRKYKLCAFFVLFTLIIFVIISFLNGYFGSRMKTYMKNKSTNYISSLINDVLNDKLINKINTDNMVNIKYTNEYIVNSISINTKDVNQIIKDANTILVNKIKDIDNIELKIPFGAIISDTLFNNLGPNFKFKILMTSSFNIDIISNIKEFGINNSIFELSLKIIFNADTIMPLVRNLNTIEISIPIVIEIITGIVPRYYYNTNDIIPDVYD